MAPRILVLDGPNLNLLGTREPHLYGSASLDEVIARATAVGADLGLEVEHLQSNHEGVLLDALHAARGRVAGLVVNAGGLSHTSIALRDALAAAEVPIGEVHVTNIHAREEFRRHSYVSTVAAFVIAGAGGRGYELAIRRMADLVGSADA